MRARVAVVAVVAVYLILAPHPKNKEQKLKLEKMVFKDWSESKKQKEQNIGCLVWFAVDNKKRGGTIVHILLIFTYVAYRHHRSFFLLKHQ